MCVRVILYFKTFIERGYKKYCICFFYCPISCNNLKNCSMFSCQCMTSVLKLLFRIDNTHYSCSVSYLFSSHTYCSLYYSWTYGAVLLNWSSPLPPFLFFMFHEWRGTLCTVLYFLQSYILFLHLLECILLNCGMFKILYR